MKKFIDVLVVGMVMVVCVIAVTAMIYVSDKPGTSILQLAETGNPDKIRVIQQGDIVSVDVDADYTSVKFADGTVRKCTTGPTVGIYPLPEGEIKPRAIIGYVYDYPDNHDWGHHLALDIGLPRGGQYDQLLGALWRLGTPKEVHLDLTP